MAYSKKDVELEVKLALEQFAMWMILEQCRESLRGETGEKRKTSKEYVAEYLERESTNTVWK